MPARMRLQRHGKKGRPFYHVVIADGRAPRDGRFIEKIGTYNPLTRPAEINIDIDKALQWLQHGAQPSDTVRAILSYKGILYKYHLLKGVEKGALTEEQAEARFTEWKSQKDARIESKRKEYKNVVSSEEKKRLEHEAKINAAKAGAIAKKLAKAIAAEAAAEEEESIEASAPEAAPEVVAEVAPEPATVAEVAETEAPAEAPAATSGETPAPEGETRPEA